MKGGVPNHEFGHGDGVSDIGAAAERQCDARHSGQTHMERGGVLEYPFTAAGALAYQAGGAAEGCEAGAHAWQVQSECSAAATALGPERRPGPSQDAHPYRPGGRTLYECDAREQLLEGPRL